MSYFPYGLVESRWRFGLKIVVSTKMFLVHEYGSVEGESYGLSTFQFLITLVISRCVCESNRSLSGEISSTGDGDSPRYGSYRRVVSPGMALLCCNDNSSATFLYSQSRSVSAWVLFPCWLWWFSQDTSSFVGSDYFGFDRDYFAESGLWSRNQQEAVWRWHAMDYGLADLVYYGYLVGC